MCAKMIRHLGAGICSLCIICSSLAYSRTAQNWESAYSSWLKQQTPSSSAATVVMLRDLDLDGVPELFYGWSSSDIGVIENAWTFRNGEMSPLTLQSGETPFSPSYISDLRLYHNGTTDAFRYDGAYVYNHNGVGYDAWKPVTFNRDIISIGETAYQLSWNMQNELHQKTYTGYLFDGEPLDADAFQSRIDAYYKGWVNVDNATLMSVGAEVTYAPNMEDVGSLQLVGIEDDTAKWNSDAVDAFFAHWTPMIVKGQITANVNQMHIMIDGENHTLQTYMLFGNNYVKLRDLAALLSNTEHRYQIAWDGNAVQITTGEIYTPQNAEVIAMLSPVPAKYSTQPIFIDSIQSGMVAYEINGNNYVRLRDAGCSLGFKVSWDASTGMVMLF
ncbi:copper amine oxidase N-terminal domain-containing protein [Intestinibacillus massiliensis]|nr:copper amine oxidase N-terminal domain-containing protein [Intestinibacillus massiliensis]